MCTAIIACCVATYRPLVERISFGFFLTSKGATQENSGATGHQGWGKISVQRDIAIELESSTNITPFAGPDTETARLKDANNFAVAIIPDPQSDVHSQHWYGSPSQNWHADVTTNGSRTF